MTSHNDSLTDWQAIQLSLYLMAKNEGRKAVNQLIREACQKAADNGDHRRAQQLVGDIPYIGPALAYETLAALGRFLAEQEDA